MLERLLEILLYNVSWILSLSIQSDITEFHRLVNNRNFFCTVLEAKKYKTDVLANSVSVRIESLSHIASLHGGNGERTLYCCC